MGLDECGLSAYSLQVLVGLNFLSVEQYYSQYDLNGCCLRAPWIMEKTTSKRTFLSEKISLARRAGEKSSGSSKQLNTTSRVQYI